MPHQINIKPNYTLLEAVRHFRSVDVRSHVTTAHAHQCCIFQSYVKTVPSRTIDYEIDYL